MPESVSRHALLRRSTVTRVHVLSVVKVAIVFWTLAGLLLIAALFVTWSLLTAAGAVEDAESFVMDMTGVESFRIMSGPLLTGLILCIALLVLLSVILSVVGAVFYNALARVFGGIEVSLLDEAVPATVLEVPTVDRSRGNGNGEEPSVPAPETTAPVAAVDGTDITDVAPVRSADPRDVPY
jgi:hypothetical protein